jgi:predicted enzyme related to lactoylglutathione lyase
MKIEGVDIGLVSASDALADFYEAAVGLERLEARTFPFATVHRLACGPATLKIMVPTATPASAPTSAQFWDVAGPRYVTLWVDDLDALTTRWAAHGGTVTMAATEIRPGVRTAMLADPDGNAVEAMQAG